MSAAAVSNNNPLFMSIRMNSSRNSFHFAVFVITSTRGRALNYVTCGRLTYSAFRFKGDMRKCGGLNAGPNRQQSGRPAYGAPTVLKALALAVSLTGAHSAVAPFSDFLRPVAACGLMVYGVVLCPNSLWGGCFLN